MTKSQQLELLQTRVTDALGSLQRARDCANELKTVLTPIDGANYVAAYAYVDSNVEYAIRDLRKALEESQ